MTLLINQKELKIPTYVDPKGKNWDKYYGASVLTPNLKEAEEAIGRSLVNDKEVEEAGMELCKKLSLSACLITRGPNGMSYINKDFKLHVISEAKEIFDVSGAGDTVIASFVSGIVAGFDPELQHDLQIKQQVLLLDTSGLLQLEYRVIGREYQ